jgi:SAM-dependent MidA family methyltransferase
MQEALYHPEFGYYAARIREVGPGGDFSTSATLDASLGSSIAAWIVEKAKRLRWQWIPVIEIGAGNGALGHSVLRSLDWKYRWRTRYMIHETSPVLRKRQESMLKWRGVQWINSLSAALKQSGGRALVFSNELVDAFPCRIFQKRTQGWEELGVRIGIDGSLSETFLGSLHSDSWFAPFDKLPVGQRVERLDSFRDWIGEWSGAWTEGALLTIDYGDLSDQLYGHSRNGSLLGSLRAYWRHQRLTGRDIYARFGMQDLTADVNFSDLIAWGAALGWRNSPLQTQREFVKSWLPEKKRALLSERFTTPGEAGDAFKVLEQTPGNTSPN